MQFLKWLSKPEHWITVVVATILGVWLLRVGYWLIGIESSLPLVGQVLSVLVGVLGGKYYFYLRGAE